ncbi:MAG: hypothetical protein MJZ66_05810 [Bacteroidales bacterium]|nr:hypothetical protein [Bacteroidales bacterium]
MSDTVQQTVDTREYAWADISVLIGGKPIVGLLSVQYSQKQDKKPLYGKGNKPIAIQPGNVTNDGTIKITQSELYALREASPDKSILSLNVDIQVAYGNPPMPVRSDMLVGCQFTEETMSMDQGASNMEVSVPFVFLDRKKAL